MVFRATSPQAASVVNCVSLMRLMVAFKSDLMTPWSCSVWREVIRSVLLPTSSQRSIWAKNWSVVSRPPGIRVRTM